MYQYIGSLLEKKKSNVSTLSVNWNELGEKCEWFLNYKKSLWWDKTQAIFELQTVITYLYELAEFLFKQEKFSKLSSCLHLGLEKIKLMSIRKRMFNVLHYEKFHTILLANIIAVCFSQNGKTRCGGEGNNLQGFF